MAHHTHAPYLAVFEYLLTKGADASLMTTVGWPDPSTVRLWIDTLSARMPHGTVLGIHLCTATPPVGCLLPVAGRAAAKRAYVSSMLRFVPRFVQTLQPVLWLACRARPAYHCRCWTWQQKRCTLLYIANRAAPQLL